MEEFSHLDKSFTQLFWKLSKPHTRDSAIQEFITFYSSVDNEKRPLYIKYGLNRLVKGLKSLRHQARLGFSNALVQLVLDFSKDIPTGTIIESFKKHVYNDRPDCKAELTGQRLAFVFCVMILVQSKRVPQLSVADLDVVLVPLLELFSRKSFTPAILIAIGDVAVATHKEIFESHFPKILNAIVPSYLHDMMDSDRILFCLKVNAAHHESLKKMEISLPNDYLTPESQNNFFAALATGQETSAFSIAQFLMQKPKISKQFLTAVNEIMESESSPIKHKSICLKLAFHLLSRPSFNSSSVHSLFSPVMCTFLQRQLSNRHFVLHQYCSTTIQKLTLTSTAKPGIDVTMTTDVALVFFKTIVKFDPIFDLSNSSFNKVVSGLLGVLPADSKTCSALIDYEHQLESVFQKTEDNEEGEKKRTFVADHLKLLITSGKMDSKDVPSVLQFMMETALFNPTKSQKSSVASHLVMQAAFYKCLDSLATQQRRVGQDKSLNYLSILHQILNNAVDRLSIKKPVNHLNQELSSDEMIELKRQLTRTVSDLREQKDKDKSSATLESVLVLLRGHLCLQALSDWSSLSEVIDDVDKCQQKALKSNTAKRKSHSNQEGSEEHHWSEVLTDCLVSLLSQSSHLLRSSVGLVFSLVVPHLTSNCAQLIRDVLITRVHTGGVTEEDDLVAFEEDEEDEGIDDEAPTEPESGTESTQSINNGAMDVDEDLANENGDDEDDSSESDLDDIGADDDEMTGPELDQLRQRVGRAIGVPNDDDADDAENMVATDAEMFKLDAALIAAFKAGRKGQTKRLEKEKSRQLMQVKMRCLDLYEVILTDCNNIEVMLPTLITLVELASNFEDELKIRVNTMTSLLKKRISGKSNFTLSKESKSKVEAGLKTLFDIAKKAPPSNNFLTVFAAILHFIFKSVDQTLVNQSVKENVEDFFENRSSHLNRAVFTNLFDKCPNLVWSLKVPLLSYAENTSIRPYCRTQAFTLILQMGRKTASIPEATVADVQLLASSVFHKALISVPWKSDFSKQPSLTQAGLEALCWALQTNKTLIKDLPSDFITAINKVYPKLNQDAKRAVKKSASIISQMTKSGTSNSKKKQKRVVAMETEDQENQSSDSDEEEENKPQSKRIKIS